MEGKILIIDDEPEIRKIFETYFKERGYKVITAPSGLDGIVRFMQERPQVVLLDIMMPGANGLDTMKKMKEIDKNVKVIIITGAIDAAYAHAAEENGAADFLVKPVGLNHLLKVLLSVLALQVG